jgi:hypothetical protein
MFTLARQQHITTSATCQPPRRYVSSQTFRAVNMTGRRKDNSIIPFINLVKFREMEEHQNSICVIAKTAKVWGKPEFKEK